MKMDSNLSSHLTRRDFLRSGTVGIGSLALSSLVPNDLCATSPEPGRVRPPMFPAKAKNVIFLHMVGGPSHVDLLDPKPALKRYDGQPLPEEIVRGVKFAFVSPDAKAMASRYRFQPRGQSGIEMSDLIPHLGEIADEITLVRSMQTDEFNHGAAELFMHTGSGRLGRPSFGSWAAYGLGSENRNMPAFVVLMEGGTTASGKNLWSSGFLPSSYQGVHLRSGPDPVLYLANPKGMEHRDRGAVIDAVNELNRLQFARAGDPEILTRIKQYELAFKMQSSVPDLMRIDEEPEHILKLYGAEPGKSSFANTCLLSRRLVEKGVRFVQVYMSNWDHHGSIHSSLPARCREMDQAAAALIKDLKQRGLLDETLVIWGGEFGRTPMVQALAAGGETQAPGRDHHKDGFSIWMAGGGVKAGYVHGATDEFGFRAIKDPVHVHDFQATVLHLLGLDHTKLTFRSQGRDFRLTDVHGKVVNALLA
jgi:hypothetical protein